MKENLKHLSQYQQLSLWKNRDTHTISNVIARSALFSPIQKKKDRIIKKFETVYFGHGVRIKYFGFQLDMSDQDVWINLVRISKVQHNEKIFFSGSYFLQTINKTNSGKNYKWLEQALTRLSTAKLKIIKEKTKETYSVNLVDATGHDPNKNKFYVRLGEEALQLFKKNNWSYIDFKKRKNLSNYAKWLQSYCVTHSNPINRFKVTTIQKQSNNQNTQKTRYLNKLKTAATELQTYNIIKQFSITPNTDNELVFTYIKK